MSERNQGSRSKDVLEKTLRSQLKTALRAYQDAAAEHNEAIQAAQADGWKLNADGHQTIHRAARIHHDTLERYTRILEALAGLEFPRGLGKPGPAEAAEARVGPLTPRENEVLKLIAIGLTSKQIAARLKISFKTVVVHRYQLMRKLDVHDVVSLVRYAIRNNLTEV